MRHMMTWDRLYVLLTAALMVTAFYGLESCAGLATPQNTEQQIAYGYAAVTGARASANDALANKQISSAKWAQITSQIDLARASLDTSTGFLNNKMPTDALSSLQAAQRILNGALAMLKETK